MSIIGLVINLIIIGVLLYFVNSAPFIDPRIKWLICAVVIIATLVWLAESFGVFGPVHWNRRI